MSLRPTLSLKQRANAEVSPISSPDKRSPEERQRDYERSVKKAKAARRKRQREAYQTLINMRFKAPITKGCGTALTLIIKEQGHSHKAAKAAIQRWVRSDSYLNQLIASTHRYQLDGSEAELISEQEKVFSQSILEKREKSLTKQES